MAFSIDAVQVEVLSADMKSFLKEVNDAGIRIYQTEYIDDLSIRLWMNRRDYLYLKETTKHAQKMEVIRQSGSMQYVKKILGRPVLIAYLLLCIALSVILPTRILFVDVSGNTQIAKNLILEQATACGIGFWASRRDVRSEKVKNALLQRIPQLKWAAVTTNGCTATIHVAEEEVITEDKQYRVGSIVANCDGVIRSMTATKGTPLCQAGDVVTAGQTLISGYTDCGLSLLATQAQGEIYAATKHSVKAISAKPSVIRGNTTAQQTRYSIRIGKKLIKLYNGSGISDTDCVRIYTEKSVNLPGWYALPVALIREDLVQTAPPPDEAVWTPSWMEDSVARYIREQMLAGSIVASTMQMHYDEDACYLNGTFICDEMIGVVKSEENIQGDAESD